MTSLYDNMYVQKRGLSPLIASVLLIAFTVTLFLIISSWVQKSIVDPGLEQSGEKISKALDCLSAEISIDSACAQNDNKNISVSFDNDGDIALLGVNIRVIGASGAQSFDKSDALQPLERKKYIETVDDAKVGAITEIEVYPKLESGICRSNSVSKKPTAQVTCS